MDLLPKAKEIAWEILSGGYKPAVWVDPTVYEATIRMSSRFFGW